jgi:hypothetical protein
MDREAQAKEAVVRMVEEQDRAVGRALERGGLPTAHDHEQAYDALMRARDQLEGIVWRVEGVCEATDAGKLPQPVTLENIGVVAVMADDAERFAAELQQFAGRLRGRVGALDAYRDRSGSAVSTRLSD